MSTSEQYRAKAAEYTELAKAASSPDEACEFHKLEKSFTALADNEQWVTDHHDQTLHAPELGNTGAVNLAVEAKARPLMTGDGGYLPPAEDTAVMGSDALRGCQ